jgi:hypothetical protein
MKKKTFQINIPEPCNESWDKMTPQEKGRFCGNCKKTIIDYSLQPDRVIAQAIKEGNGKICGRFRTDQLQRDIVLEPQFYQNTRWKTFGLMLSGLLAAGALKGQDNQNHLSATPSFEVSTNTSVKKDIQRPLKKEVKITGKLVDKDNGEALIAATIYVKNTDYGAVTDIEGIFELDIWLEPDWLENGLVLDVSYTGYFNREIEITKETLQKYNNRMGASHFVA